MVTADLGFLIHGFIFVLGIKISSKLEGGEGIVYRLENVYMRMKNCSTESSNKINYLEINSFIIYTFLNLEKFHQI